MEMWKCHTSEKQFPLPNEDSQVFWEGCRRGRLLIQQCDTCHTFRFPPSPLCPACLSTGTTWQSDPGNGIVETFCVYHVALASPAWETELPYTVVVVRLQYSGVSMLSNLRCGDPAVARIGLPVRLVFEPVSERLSLPKFVPASEGLVKCRM